MKIVSLKPHRFTTQERSDAETLQRVLGSSHLEIMRTEDGKVFLQSVATVNQKHEAMIQLKINGQMFPSVEPGEIIKLAEITGGEQP